MLAREDDNDQWDGRLSVVEAAGRLFGTEARDRVWAEFGGRSIWIPFSENLRPDHPLCRALGTKRASVVADELGSTIVNEPLYPGSGHRARRAAVLGETLAGKPAHEIAAQLGITQRRVHQIRAALREAGKLPPPIWPGRPRKE